MVSWGLWIYVIYVEFISCEVIRVPSAMVLQKKKILFPSGQVIVSCEQKSAEPKAKLSFAVVRWRKMYLVDHDESTTSKSEKKRKGHLNPSRIIPWKFFRTVCSHWILWCLSYLDVSRGSNFWCNWLLYRKLLSTSWLALVPALLRRGVVTFCEWHVLWGAMMFATPKNTRSGFDSGN